RYRWHLILQAIRGDIGRTSPAVNPPVVLASLPGRRLVPKALEPAAFPGRAYRVFSMYEATESTRAASREADTASASRGPRIPAMAFQNVVGSSLAIRKVIDLGCKVAAHPGTPVPIQGET